VERALQSVAFDFEFSQASRSIRGVCGGQTSAGNVVRRKRKNTVIY
jgi:hypothetical protein